MFALNDYANYTLTSLLWANYCPIEKYLPNLNSKYLSKTIFNNKKGIKRNTAQKLPVIPQIGITML